MKIDRMATMKHNDINAAGAIPKVSLVKREPSKRARKRTIVFRVLGLLFPFALLLCAEGAGRCYVWVKYGIPGKSYGLWQSDPELGAIHAVNGYNTQTQTNDWGFRGTENVFAPKPAGSLRVVCYGGSTTFCYNLPDGQTWPERLQERLRAEAGHEKDQVLNGGHICWSSGHLLVRAKRELPKLRPDVVILYSGINEEMNAMVLALEGCNFEAMLTQKDFGRIGKSFDQCRWLKRNCVLVRLWDYTIRPLFTKHDSPETNQVKNRTADLSSIAQSRDGFFDHWKWHNYVHNLTEFRETVNDCGATLLFVAQVGTPDIERTTPYLRYSAEGLGVMSQLGVSTCDPRTIFSLQSDQERLFASTGVHVSAAGAELLADGIFECLKHRGPAVAKGPVRH